MTEKTGHCPLCNEEFGGEDVESVVCPGCGITLRKFVPVVRINRSWWWEFTATSIANLHKLWLSSKEKQ